MAAGCDSLRRPGWSATRLASSWGGWFGYRPGTAGEQVFRLPPDLPTGDYRVAVRYQADPPAMDQFENGHPTLSGPPSTSVWCGLLRRSFHIGDRLG